MFNISQDRFKKDAVFISRGREEITRKQKLDIEVVANLCLDKQKMRTRIFMNIK